MTRPARPDFLILGAPKAGTTALHAALTRHPDVFMSSPKEPKYWMCDDAPPPHFRGPGDQHSQQEWVWRRRTTSGSSTPRRPRPGARREHAVLPLAPRRPAPDRRAAARRPADRRRARPHRPRLQQLDAPVVRRARAGSRLREGVRARARADREGVGAVLALRASSGGTASSSRTCSATSTGSACWSCATATIVDDPQGAVDRACQFLGIAPGLIETIPHDNSRSFVEPGPRSAVLGRVLRAGAWAGQFAPPQVWRRASAPLIRRMSGGDAVRPKLSAQARARLLPYFADDIALLARADRRVLRRLAVDREPRLVPRAQQGLVTRR